MKMLIKNATIADYSIFDTTKKDIYIEDGIIKDININLNIQDAEIIDANNYIAMPGFVDLNCNICDPGFEDREDIQTVSISAAKGGFTSITCQPNTNPVIDNKATLEYIISRSKIVSPINIYPYGSMTKNCLGEAMAEIGDMVFAGAVAFSNGYCFIRNSNLLRNIFKYSSLFKVPIVMHCQNEDLAKDGVMNEGIMSTVLGLKAIPNEAEDIEIARNIILAESTNCKLHVSSVSTKGAVKLIRNAKQRGHNITSDTSPQYFTLTDNEVEGYNTFSKLNPPLRTQEDIDEIIEGLKDGTIDAISSSHNPCTVETKNIEFDNASFGISALETAFSISYTYLVEKNILSLPQLVSKLAYNPAQILKIRKGKLEIGSDADIVIADIKNDYEIDANLFYSKAKFSPFQGRAIKGKIIHTIVKGKQIF